MNGPESHGAALCVPLIVENFPGTRNPRDLPASLVAQIHRWCYARVMKCCAFLLCCFLPLFCRAENARILATGNALLEHVQAAMKLFDDKPLSQDEGVKASELAGYLAAFYDMAELGEATGAVFKFKLRLDIPLSQTVRILDRMEPLPPK